MTEVRLLPTDQVIAAATAEVEITDPKGHVIKLRKAGALAQFKFAEALGESASNGVCFRMAYPLVFIASIDGMPVSLRNKLQIEALLQRLDDDGLAAVSEAAVEHYGRQDPEADKDELKKS